MLPPEQVLCGACGFLTLEDIRALLSSCKHPWRHTRQLFLSLLAQPPLEHLRVPRALSTSTLAALYKELSTTATRLLHSTTCGVHLPAKVLECHGHARGLVLLALQRIARVCGDDFARLLACGKHVHVHVHRTLREYALDEEIQAKGLHTLVLLCRPLGAPEGSIVRRHPLTPHTWEECPILGDAVADALKNHSRNPEVIANAAWAASNIALSERQWTWLVEHDVCHMLTAALERFPNEELLQLRGLSAFINILRPDADLRRIVCLACKAHESSGRPGSKVSERAIWVLYIVAKWHPAALLQMHNNRARQCCVDILLEDKQLVTFAASLACCVLRNVFHEEPAHIIDEIEFTDDAENGALHNVDHAQGLLATMTI